jgi:hypothetical protein
MKITSDRLAAFAAVLVLLVGYVGMFRPFESAIAERYQQLDVDRALLDRRHAIVRRTDDLRLQAHDLRRWLAETGLFDDHTKLVHRLLHGGDGSSRKPRRGYLHHRQHRVARGVGTADAHPT